MTVVMIEGVIRTRDEALMRQDVEVGEGSAFGKERSTLIENVEITLEQDETSWGGTFDSQNVFFMPGQECFIVSGDCYVGEISIRRLIRTETGMTVHFRGSGTMYLDLL